MDELFDREPPIRQPKRKGNKYPPVGAVEEVIKRYLYPRLVKEKYYSSRWYDPEDFLIKENLANRLGLPIELVGPALNRLARAGFLKKIEYPHYKENGKPNTVKLSGQRLEWHPNLGWVYEAKVKHDFWGLNISPRQLRYNYNMGYSAVIKKVARIKRKRRHKADRTKNFKLRKTWSSVDGRYHTEKVNAFTGVKYRQVNWDGFAYEILEESDIYISYGKEHGILDKVESKKEEPPEKERCPRCGGTIKYKRQRGKARKAHKRRFCNLNVCERVMNS